MYCKKCGRKLDDNMRFCDRCGQSVRQSRNSGGEARRREIKELKEERLNRRQKLEEREIKKKRQKQRKNKKRTTVLSFIFLALLLCFVAAMISYSFTAEKSQNAPWRTGDGPVALNATPTPEVSLAPTQTAYALTAEQNADPVNSDGYREYTLGGVVFPYPTVFTRQNTSAGVKLSAYDKEGGGNIALTEQSPVSGAAKDRLGEFSRSCGGDISYSRAGDGWYVIDYSQNGILYHRKALIHNNIEYGYDFSYSADSVSAKDYEEYIRYMDENFKM
ncbi:MAG: zinc ribbon domain-containing protein [Clostridiales bacterium]|nr:zinc ribbon domain-containing protein [Clostridiales bacterium]